MFAFNNEYGLPYPEIQVNKTTHTDTHRKAPFICVLIKTFPSLSLFLCVCVCVSNLYLHDQTEK